MAEFTGERVVPGQVDIDLWNEHLARYAFAGRLAAGRRVLDAGCGTGYGSAELSGTARRVVGIDCSAEAVNYASEHYGASNLDFIEGSCAALPLRDASFELVVSFEVIEHLAEWRAFLREARRVLAPAGTLIVSTPNKDYYAESRRQTGPNPFHVHEFEFEEFAGELRALFPQVSMYLQNHVYGIAFDPRDGAGLELQVGSGRGEPGEAHFFLAVCALAPREQAGLLYLPGTANVLRERERHIERLERDVAGLRQDKQTLVEMFREQKDQLDQSNRWAADLDQQLRLAQARIVALQEEMEQKTAGYEAKITGLEQENREKAEWARRTQAELTECARLLDTAEKTVEERTAWAQRLDGELRQREAQLSAVRASRWFKLGRAAGLGPMLDDNGRG